MKVDRILTLILVISIGSMFTFAGLWMMFSGGKRVYQAIGTKNWNQVTGMIVESRVDTSKDSEDRTEYRAVVLYTYSFQDKTYYGKRIHYGYSASSDRTDSEELVGRYSPGEPVPVYINPNRPKECVLVRGIQKYALLEIWFGFGVAFFGIWSTVFGAYILRSPIEFIHASHMSPTNSAVVD